MKMRASPIRRSVTKAIATVREQRSMHRAAKTMPMPVPWDWAAARVLPLLAGPYIDDDTPLVRSVADIGCTLVYGLPLGRGFALVDVAVAERWECTASQIHERAMSNLQARATALPDGVARNGTLSGRIVRLIDGRPTWAASILLLPDVLYRLFGDFDQILTAPGRGTLLSLPIDTPASVVADITVDFERSQTYPLDLDPFVLIDGRLRWSSTADDDEFDDLDPVH